MIFGVSTPRTPGATLTSDLISLPNPEDLGSNFQIYTSHGPTIIMPTWFCAREAYESVGKFSEDGRGTPEDLIFFYRHLDLGGRVIRVEEDLLMYRYHSVRAERGRVRALECRNPILKFSHLPLTSSSFQHATTFSILEGTIWNIRLERLQNNVLSKWPSFTIWNAGKQGRKFFRSLSDENQKKVNPKHPDIHQTHHDHRLSCMCCGVSLLQSL